MDRGTWIRMSGTIRRGMLLGRSRVVLALTAALLGGCVGRGDYEVLEANLRQQQDVAANCRRQLAEAQQELSTSRVEVDQLRGRLAAVGTPVPQEQSEPLARVTGVKFNPMMTGGRDQDGIPGQERVTAVLSPHDQDGDLVKLSGQIDLELLDLARTGEDQRIGQWSYSSEQSRDLWHSGFLASGYQFDLPVKTSPKNGQAILHGRLTTSDGRQFDTTVPIALAESEAALPQELAPPKIARPLSSSSRRARSAIGGGGFHISSADDDQPVQPAAYARRDGASDRRSSQDRPPARPAPTPPGDDPVWPPRDDPEPPAQNKTTTADSPEVGSDTSAADRPRSFPDGVRTSDRWTDESIPRIR